jgi:hypothetical protein
MPPQYGLTHEQTQQLAYQQYLQTQGQPYPMPPQVRTSHSLLSNDNVTNPICSKHVPDASMKACSLVISARVVCYLPTRVPTCEKLTRRFRRKILMLAGMSILSLHVANLILRCSLMRPMRTSGNYRENCICSMEYTFDFSLTFGS